MPSFTCSTAPDLVRLALAVGITVGWEPTGAVWAEVTNRRSRRQNHVLSRLRANRHSPAVLAGTYYDGDFRREQ